VVEHLPNVQGPGFNLQYHENQIKQKLTWGVQKLLQEIKVPLSVRRGRKESGHKVSRSGQPVLQVNL
jgi:hypothetical protein